MLTLRKSTISPSSHYVSIPITMSINVGTKDTTMVVHFQNAPAKKKQDIHYETYCLFALLVITCRQSRLKRQQRGCDSPKTKQPLMRETETRRNSPITDTTVVCPRWFGHDAFFADRNKWAAIFFLNEKGNFVMVLVVHLISEFIRGSPENGSCHLTEGRYPGEVLAAL